MRFIDVKENDYLGWLTEVLYLLSFFGLLLFANNTAQKIGRMGNNTSTTV
jgi:hypothetical protein